MPNSGAPFPFDRTCAPCEAWRLAWKASEIWWTSLYKVASGASCLGGTLSGAGPAAPWALGQWHRAMAEEVAADMEVGLAMQRAGYEMMLGRFDPWCSSHRILDPLDRRVVAGSSRRLALRQAGVRSRNPSK